MENNDSCDICAHLMRFDYNHSQAVREAGLVNIAELPDGGKDVEMISETDHDPNI